MTTPRLQLAEDLLRRFVAAQRAYQLYSKGHPIVGQNLDALGEVIQLLHDLSPSVVLGVVGGEVIVDDMPVTKSESWASFVRRLRQVGIERITIDRGVTAEELAALLVAVNEQEAQAAGDSPAFPHLPHIRVGRVTIEQQFESLRDMATLIRMYDEAVSSAQAVWESARTEGQPDATAARAMIEGLAQAVSQNRTALLALTTLKDYDNYTFTHMVNVSILTMGQARALGLDGRSLREFGLAGLMHDIGKVNTPLEVLNKPDKLTEAEFAVMMRHPVDGAEMLRAVSDIPVMAPIVAFEHHLRLDGSGYPVGTRRKTLNLATMLCSISDVYDAMRSQRQYQQAFPTDRILAVLKRADGQQFDQHLVRRFSQLLGIYPVGNLVELNTGEIAVVVRVHAPEPYRPRVRVLYDQAGNRLDFSYDINLWEVVAEAGRASVIVKPVDPATVDVDPLSCIDLQ